MPPVLTKEEIAKLQTIPKELRRAAAKRLLQFRTEQATAAPEVPTFSVAAPEQREQVFTKVATQDVDWNTVVSDTGDDLRRRFGDENVKPILEPVSVTGGATAPSVTREIAGYAYTDPHTEKNYEFRFAPLVDTFNQRRESLFRAAAETEKGAPLLERMEAGVKLPKEGAQESTEKEHYWKAKGYETLPVGQDLFIRKEQGERWTQVDPPNVEVGDVLEAYGPAMEIIPGTIGAAVGAAGGPAGSALGGALGDIYGSIMRQIDSGMLSGEEAIGILERLKMLGENVIPGLLGELGGAAAGAAWKGLTRGRTIEGLQELISGKIPKRAIAGRLAEAERLERNIPGLHLRPGQAVQSESGLGLETALKSKEATAQIMKDTDVQQANALLKHLQGVVKDVAGGKSVYGGSGERVVAPYKGLISSLKGQRNNAWNSMFGQAYQATKGRKVIPMTNTVEHIDAILADTEPVGSEAKATIEKFKELRKDIFRVSKTKSKTTPRLNIRQFQNILSDQTGQLHGKGTWIEGMDKGREKSLLSGLVDALNRDLDAFSASAGANKVAAQKLRQARALYAEHMRIINNARDIVLDNLMKAHGRKDIKTIAQFAKSLVSGSAEPTRTRKVMKILEAADPKTASEVRAEALKFIIDKAVDTNGNLKPSTFATLLSKQGGGGSSQGIGGSRVVSALFEGSPEGHRQLMKIADALDVSQRISKRGTTAGGARTAPLQFLNRALNVIKPVGAVIDIGGIGAKASELLAPLSDSTILASALNNPAHRKALLGIVAPPPGLSTNKWIAKVENFAAQLNRLQARMSGKYVSALSSELPSAEATREETPQEETSQEEVQQP